MCEEFANGLSDKLTRFRQIISYTSDVMDTALRFDYIRTNPFKLAKFPKERRKSKSSNYFFLRQELNMCLESLKQKKKYIQYAFYRLIAYTGMRKGEALALTWNDVNFTNKTLSINKAVAYSKTKKKYITTTKTKEPRTIFLDEETLLVLKAWKYKQEAELIMLNHSNSNSNNQLIFNNTKNKMLQLGQPNEWLRKIIAEYKFKYITVHGLRHTHATLLVEAEANLAGIQHRLGHSPSKNTTLETYVHVTEKIQLDTLNKFKMYLSIQK